MPEEKRPPQVFISYSRRDLAFVEGLAADLQAAGLDVWYDLSGLEGGVQLLLYNSSGKLKHNVCWKTPSQSISLRRAQYCRIKLLQATVLPNLIQGLVC